MTYEPDLAFIHDAGFGGFARAGGAWVADELRSRGVESGTVIELGCGSGISSELLAAAGYHVIGFDQSAAMVDLARARLPQATFHVASFLDSQLPPCVAVTAIGEVFNYCFDSRNRAAKWRTWIRNVHRALLPGGLFVFDGATPGRVPGGRRRGYTEGDGWACLFEATEDTARQTVTRQITTFRAVDAAQSSPATAGLYRRTEETHRLRLFDRRTIIADLRAAGFAVRTLQGYGKFQFPAGYLGICARKR